MHRPYLISLVFLLLLISRPLSAASNAHDKSLDVGVVPYLSARVLVASYEPMRIYLERELARPVKFYTSISFKSFYQNARQGNYDLVITAAHFARMMQKNDQFIPLVRYTNGGRSLLLSTHDSPIKTMQDLRGRLIAVPDKLSLASIVSMTSLREHGLKAGTDFRILDVPSFASAILSVQKGEADAAVTAAGALAQMPMELRESMKTVVDAGEFTSLVFLAHPRLDPITTNQIYNKLLKFGSESAEGREFFRNTGFGSIIPVKSRDMEKLDRYIETTNRMLNELP